MGSNTHMQENEQQASRVGQRATVGKVKSSRDRWSSTKESGRQVWKSGMQTEDKVAVYETKERALKLEKASRRDGVGEARRAFTVKL